VTTLTVMSETHTDIPSAYPPPDDFAAQANATEDLYREAEADRLAFWGKQANRLSWETPFTEVEGLGVAADGVVTVAAGATDGTLLVRLGPATGAVRGVLARSLRTPPRSTPRST